MQTIEKLSDEINKIFDIIAVVYDPTILCFDSMDIVIKKFNEAFTISSNIDMSVLNTELLIDVDTNDDIDEKLYIIESEFDRLLDWKSDIVDIVKIKELQQSDLKPYFEKLGHLRITCSVQYKAKITECFINLGLRLLKARIELNKIIENVKMQKELQDKIAHLNDYRASMHNIKLAPDKLKEFTLALYRMYNNNFFLPVSNKYLVSELDVIRAFEEFFSVDIVTSDWFTPDFYFESDSILMPENKKPTALMESPERLKKELTTYFINLPFDTFLDSFRDEFKTEKGKNIAILIYVLKKHEPVLLNIPYGKMKKFHTLLKSFFNTDIGTYQSVANYVVHAKTNSEEIKQLTERLEKILHH